MTNDTTTASVRRPLAAQMIEELRLHHAGRARAVVAHKASQGTQAEKTADDQTLDALWSKFQGDTAAPDAMPGDAITPVPTRQV